MIMAPGRSATSARAHVISGRCPAAGGGRYWIAQAYPAWPASDPPASRGLRETSLTERGVAAPDVLEEDS
jgi:hypothetical protein